MKNQLDTFPYSRKQRRQAMISIKIRLFGSLLAAGVITLVAETAQAFEITQPIPNTIENACVDVFKADTSNGTTIQSYPCVGDKAEQWTMVNGLLEGVGTDAGVATCMAASGSTSGKVELENCNSNPPPHTTWALIATSLSSLIVTTVGNARIDCLDSQGKYGSGAQLVVVGCTAGLASQKWEVRDILFVQSMPGTNEHACVDARGNSIANNTPTDAYPCTLGFNERWTYLNGQLLVGNGSSSSASTCLTESPVGTVVLQTCNIGAVRQQWIIASSGAVQNFFSGNCLGSGSKYGDVQLTDTACDIVDPRSSQVWVLQ
jgi:hypothetical protein